MNAKSTTVAFSPSLLHYKTTNPQPCTQHTQHDSLQANTPPASPEPLQATRPSPLHNLPSPPPNSVIHHSRPRMLRPRRRLHQRSSPPHNEIRHRLRPPRIPSLHPTRRIHLLPTPRRITHPHHPQTQRLGGQVCQHVQQAITTLLGSKERTAGEFDRQFRTVQ